MRRKIYEKLLKWKHESKGKTALIIDGARRVGKSWIAEEFARNEYASYVIVDFSKAWPKLKRIFNLYLDDLDTFFLHFQQLTRTKLVRNNALVIFDEVQKFPRAREAIKHLVAASPYSSLSPTMSSRNASVYISNSQGQMLLGMRNGRDMFLGRDMKKAITT